MDHFKQISAFVNVASRGSLSAAARSEGVTPAIIGRRLDALEERLGAKLLLRTTRRISLTFEGAAFLEDCQRILRVLAAFAPEGTSRFRRRPASAVDMWHPC
jgi:DNA-binding transcriptional LysR family regulator